MDVDYKLQEMLCHIDQLPALPGIALKILEKTRDPRASLNQIAEILAADPVLAAKVLNAVNSPFFGLARKITNLPHAVNLLGEKSVKYIALSFSLIQMFTNGKNGFDHSAFWRESLTCAVLSRLIAKALNRGDSEDMYFLGLIHNIGTLAMAQANPGKYARVLEKVRSNNMPYHTAENAVFGCTHMETGAYLIESWGLPDVFVMPVRHHHDPETMPFSCGNDSCKNELMDVRIVHLSDEICRFLHSREKTENLAAVNKLIKDYKMSPHVNLEAILEETCRQIDPLLPLFDIDSHGKVDYLALLNESKKEMYRLSFEMMGTIKKQDNAIENLSILASHDALTNLVNYRGFSEALARELADIRRHGHASVLALADLDDFKLVNDRYGHVTGDHVLQEVSRFFIRNTRENDIVARYGGEEFTFILTRTEIEQGYKTMDRLRSMLSGLRIEYQGQIVSVTMSIGVIAFPATGDQTTLELMKRADSAMYQAKTSGRNKTIVL